MKPQNLYSLFCFAFLLLLAVSQGRGQGSWAPLPPMPNAAGYMGAVAYNGRIYLFGGAAPTHLTATNKAYVFDPADSSFTALPNLPRPICSPGVVEVNGKIYVIGGGDAVVGTFYNTNYIFDPVTLTWDTAPPMPMPRGLFAIGALGSKIYVMGGGTDPTAPTRRVDVYDTESKTWAQGPDMPSARAFLASTVVNNKIYVIGGTVDAFGIGLTTVDIFEPGVGWTTGKPMPTGRFAPAAVALEGKLFVLGGSSLDASSHYFLATVEMFDLQQPGNWYPIAPMITARRAPAAAVLDSIIYVFGGMKEYAGSNVLPTSEVEYYRLTVPTNEPDVQPDAWLEQNAPNPFNGATRLAFHLDRGGDVELAVYDANGRQVQMLVRQFLPPGDYSSLFDGSGLPQGVYFAHFTVNKVEIAVRKIVVAGP